jgi:hypothetical protein
MFTLVLQQFLFFGFVIMIAGIVGLSIGSYLEKREIQRIMGVNLHDKVLQFGDLKTAESASSRVVLQETQAHQLKLITEAVDENRPVLIPKMVL